MWTQGQGTEEKGMLGGVALNFGLRHIGSTGRTSVW